MSYQRIDRISEQVRREVDRIIRDRLSDPRIRGTFSVTRAEVTRDLRYAKIYVSILEEADRAPMMAALKKAAGFVRHELGQSMIIRYAPEILFEEDHNIEYGIHIASVLKQVRSEEETNDESSDGLGITPIRGSRCCPPFKRRTASCCFAMSRLMAIRWAARWRSNCV